MGAITEKFWVELGELSNQWVEVAHMHGWTHARLFYIVQIPEHLLRSVITQTPPSCDQVFDLATTAVNSCS